MVLLYNRKLRILPGASFSLFFWEVLLSISGSTLSYDLKKTVTPNRLRGLWRMMAGFRKYYIIATVCLGISATAKTLTSLLIKYFIDNFFSSQGGPFPLYFIGLGFIGLAVLEGSFSFISGRLTAQTAEGITRRLRNYLFDHIQHLTFSYHDKTQTGELIQRSTSDVDAVRRFFADQAIGIGRIILLFIINFVAIAQLNLQLALVSVIAVPFIVITSIFFFRRVSKAYEKFQEQDAVLTTTLQENLAGVRVVKAFARQHFEIEKFNKENKEKYRLGKRLLLMNSYFWPSSDILCGAQVVGGYLFGATLAINGQISVGTFMAYMGLLIWIIWPMRNLGRLIVQTSNGLVSFGRVRDILKEDREPLDEGDANPTNPISGHIVYNNVTFHYEKGSPVLQDISFDCKPGQAIALLGSTGSGKTTLVNLLPRFYEYNDGSLTLDGVELKRYPRRFLRRNIGIVEQEPFLFSRSIRENITYGVGREVPQEEIEAAAKAAAVHDVILSFPEGYSTLVGEKGVTLSGGQKQRVAIARTLLKNPRILILDDSTSSVDTETEATIREALNNLMENRTTFIIAHRIQSIMNADLILVLDQGKIVQRGTHTTLLQQDGMYKQIFEIQTRIEAELEKEIANAS
jgi:ATP-binding cassette, subfamily B, bacterial